jgi:hypothetical protein
MISTNKALNIDLAKRTKAEESVVLSLLITKIQIVEYYFAKIEAYFRSKHEAILRDKSGDSPIPRSLISSQ